jgi:hypothetical protein
MFPLTRAFWERFGAVYGPESCRESEIRLSEVAGFDEVGEAQRERLDPVGEQVDDALVPFQEPADAQRG